MSLTVWEGAGGRGVGAKPTLLSPLCSHEQRDLVHGEYSGTLGPGLQGLNVGVNGGYFMALLSQV